MSRKSFNRNTKVVVINNGDAVDIRVVVNGRNSTTDMAPVVRGFSRIRNEQKNTVEQATGKVPEMFFTEHRKKASVVPMTPIMSVTEPSTDDKPTSGCGGCVIS